LIETEIKKEPDMRIIATSKPGNKFSPEKIKLHMEEELRQVQELYLKGICRELYQKADQPGLIFILECKDVAEAKGHIDQLVLVREEQIEITYLPLAPFKIW
jgi:hypothetical protein